MLYNKELYLARKEHFLEILKSLEDFAESMGEETADAFWNSVEDISNGDG